MFARVCSKENVRERNVRERNVRERERQRDREMVKSEKFVES